MAKVAVEGDVKPEKGSTDPSGATGGTWSAGDVKSTGYDHLTIGGKKVIHEAECTFTYKGGTATGTTSAYPDTPETVTLKAKTTLLQHGLSGVLLDGEWEKGKIGGNKLTVSAAHELASG